MPYRVYLVIAPHSGQARAHVPELPGCSIHGQNRSEVLALLPATIASYLNWLKQHGEPAPRGGDTSFEVVEWTSGAIALRPGDHAALLEPDLVPLTENDIEHYLRLMRFSRQDLLALVRGLSDTVLDWQPPSGGWTIRTVLRHVSAAERWYLDRLGLSSRLRRTHSVFDHLELTREYAYKVLSQLTLEQRATVTEKDGETWTARKVFRRFLEHEREHTGQIQDILHLL